MPKGIEIGTEIFKELEKQGRIKHEKVHARLTTALVGESPWAVEFGIWPIFDQAIFVHTTPQGWVIRLPTGL